jgi:putative tryptophan/tyrosine transport system substrate-binding protein
MGSRNLVRIDRRAFLGGVLLGVLAVPIALEAQPAGKMHRIGLFHVGLDHVPPSLDALREGLKTLGYDVHTSPAPKVSTIFEGRNLRLDWRNLADEDAARQTAREFVRDRVDLIVAFENQAVRAAQAATTEVPVFFLHVSDPVAEGFVKSLARPGGNVTGIADYLGELQGKRLEIFKELVPGIRRFLILTDHTDPATPRLMGEISRATKQLKVQLVERTATTETDLTRIFASLKTGDVDAVVIASPTLITKFPLLILRLSSERRLPLASHRRELVHEGILFSYGPDFSALGRDAARYVDRLLRGVNPADLPVQQASSLELVINLKTARALGLTIPPSLLLRANQVIE